MRNDPDDYYSHHHHHHNDNNIITIRLIITLYIYIYIVIYDLTKMIRCYLFISISIYSSLIRGENFCKIKNTNLIGKRSLGHKFFWLEVEM